MELTSYFSTLVPNLGVNPVRLATLRHRGFSHPSRPLGIYTYAIEITSNFILSLAKKSSPQKCKTQAGSC
jgi:hypothetical protein